MTTRFEVVEWCNFVQQNKYHSLWEQLTNCLINPVEQSSCWESFIQSRNSPNFMEPEGSLPCSQEPVTCPYPQSDQFTPYTHTLFLKIRFNIILSSSPRSSEWSLPSTNFNRNCVRISHFTHACYMPPCLIILIWSSLTISELIIMQFSPASCNFITYPS
jgi:hypothetical protein